jgi:septal ring factor EnvC (AmiA/AmiB activator)
MCDLAELNLDKKHRCAGCKTWTAFKDLDACARCGNDNIKWYCIGCKEIDSERLCKKHQLKQLEDDLDSECRTNDRLRGENLDLQRENRSLERDLSETQKKLEEANAKLEAIMKLLK